MFRSAAHRGPTRLTKATEGTALETEPQLSALVIAKGTREQSNSVQAQGGIAAVLSPDDCFEDHVADTLEAGGPLCHRDVVERVVAEGPQRIRELVEWGTEFDRDGDALALSREGGHGRERIAHALGDATGQEIMRATIEHFGTRPNTEMWDNTFTLDLLTHEGQCRGALVWNRQPLRKASGKARFSNSAARSGR